MRLITDLTHLLSTGGPQISSELVLVRPFVGRDVRRAEQRYP